MTAAVNNNNQVSNKTSHCHESFEWIRNDLGVTTLRYQTIDDMIKAIGLPREKLCTYCWNGECLAKDNLVDTK